MEKFLIKTQGTDHYIVNLVHGFTLKVIPPEKQPYAYERRRHVVGVEFVVPGKQFSPNKPEQEGYDFEGLDIAYFDVDRGELCNKELWFETIEYFCQLILDREPAGFIPYNYDYVLTKKKNSFLCGILAGLPWNGDTRKTTVFLN